MAAAAHSMCGQQQQCVQASASEIPQWKLINARTELAAHHASVVCVARAGAREQYAVLARNDSLLQLKRQQTHSKRHRRRGNGTLAAAAPSPLVLYRNLSDRHKRAGLVVYCIEAGSHRRQNYGTRARALWPHARTPVAAPTTRIGRQGAPLGTRPHETELRPTILAFRPCIQVANVTHTAKNQRHEECPSGAKSESTPWRDHNAVL